MYSIHLQKIDSIEKSQKMFRIFKKANVFHLHLNGI